MLPVITQLEIDTEEILEDVQPIGKTFMYDFDKGDFVMRDGKLIELFGIESLKMWIMKVMKTERFRFRIYEGVDYGVTLEDLIGSNLPRAFVESEIEREVTESLLLNPYIEDVREWTFIRDGKWMRVSFTVISPMYNTFDVEVNV